MLDLALFKRPAMVGVSLGSFTLSASIFAMFLYLTLYMQEILGYGAVPGRAPVPAPHHARLHRGPRRRQAHRADPDPVPDEPRAGPGGHRLPAHDPRRGHVVVARPAARLPGRAASASASPTRCSPRARSRWCRPSAAACRPARPAPSARSGSPPASPGSAPSSSTRSSPPWWPTSRPPPAARPSWPTAASGSARRWPRAACARRRPSIPSASGRQALLSAYQDGFASTFNHLMAIAAVIAMVGAIGCLFLVRQKDFVPSVAPGEQPAPAAPTRRRTGPRATTDRPG